MVYKDVVNALVTEVPELLRLGYRFSTAFRNAESFHHLTEREVSGAESEVASRLGVVGAKKRNKYRRIAASRQATQKKVRAG